MRSDHFLRRPHLASVALAFCLICLAQTPYLFYKPRGNYSEGIRASLSTEPNILLIGAMVDYSEPAYQNLPEKFQALFYLPGPASVTLSVRETDPRYAYWLQTDDKATWRPQTTNPFQWPTGEVIKFLNYKGTPLSLGDLAAAARLDSAAPSENERVAPVVLFHSQPPAKVDGYRFAFRSEAQASLKFSTYSETTRALLGPEQIFDMDAKKSKWVRWPAGSWADGGYRLTVTGRWKADNQPVIPRTVHFYHRASLASR